MLDKFIISRSNAKLTPDKAANGAKSRWLQHENNRLRVITFPPGHEGDHVCYKGHSIYVVAGTYEMEVGDEKITWKAGDAFIIPDDVPHRSSNPGNEEAKIIMVDTHG